MRALFIRLGFMVLVSLALSLSIAAQGRGGAAGARGAGAGARGEAPQNRGAGGRGASAELAEQRKAIQAKQRAAVEQENSSFRLAMQSIQANVKNAKDANARTLAKLEADNARRNHQAAIQRIRAEGASAMAALRK